MIILTSQIILSAIVVKKPKLLKYITAVSRKKQGALINLSTQILLAPSILKNLEESAISLLLQINTHGIPRLLWKYKRVISSDA